MGAGRKNAKKKIKRRRHAETRKAQAAQVAAQQTQRPNSAPRGTPGR